jgi:hypothetical protein
MLFMDQLPYLCAQVLCQPIQIKGFRCAIDGNTACRGGLLYRRHLRLQLQQCILEVAWLCCDGGACLVTPPILLKLQQLLVKKGYKLVPVTLRALQ